MRTLLLFLFLFFLFRVILLFFRQKQFFDPNKKKVVPEGEAEKLVCCPACQTYNSVNTAYRAGNQYYCSEKCYRKITGQ